MNSTISKPAARLVGATLNTQAGMPRSASAQGIGLAAIMVTLKLTYGLVPIIAGLDKFSNLLANWETYLNPAVLGVIPVTGAVFMKIVGVIEIAAGVLVLARPRVGGMIVTAWLIGIALSLIASGQYLDVAVRDLVMAVGAFAFASLTPLVGRMRGNELSD